MSTGVDERRRGICRSIAQQMVWKVEDLVRGNAQTRSVANELATWLYNFTSGAQMSVFEFEAAVQAAGKALAATAGRSIDFDA